LKSLPAITANEVKNRTKQDGLFCVLAMPGSAFVASVPLGGEMAVRSESLRDRGAFVGGQFCGVQPVVVGAGDAFQVPDRVIERIAVPVVDVIALRNSPVSRFPYFHVQRFDALSSEVLMRVVIRPFRPVLRLRVAVERNAVKRDDFVFRHDFTKALISISRQGMNPLPSAQIG
jgi:hypothetical protein